MNERDGTRGIGWFGETQAELERAEKEYGLEQSETYEHVVAETLRRACQRAIDEGGIESVLRPFAVLESPEVRAEWRKSIEAGARSAKRRLVATDRRYSAVLKLFALADERAPRLGLVAVGMHFVQLPHVRAGCRALARLRSAGEARDQEGRFCRLVEAVVPLVGRLYDPYLRLLWTLDGFARGDWSPPPGNTGALLQQSHARLPHLVDPVLCVVRNAEAHEGIRFLPRGRVRVRGGSRADLELTLDEFAGLLESCFRVAAPTLQAVLHLYVVRSFFLAGGALETALESMAHLASLDPAREELAAQVWQSKQAELLGPPLRYVAAHPRRDAIVELLRENQRRHEESFAGILPLSASA